MTSYHPKRRRKKKKKNVAWYKETLCQTQTSICENQNISEMSHISELLESILYLPQMQ